MEAALVSAATGALKPVIGKLGALLGDEYKRFKGVRKDIKSLKDELTAMDAFLMKMSEEEEPDVQDQVWMNEVRELSYDIEDCIDDFMQTVNDKDAKPEGFIEKIKHSLGKMKARCRIGNEIHDLKKQIIEVGERNERYKTRQAFSNAKNASADPRALAIFEHASKLVGIDEPKADIVKLLTQEDGRASAQQHPKLVSIVGSGGMGKTTLANQVYQELRGQFECRAFLSVSRNPDLMNILRTILSVVTGERYVDTEAGSIQQLISKITDFLAYKRYFVVVDDIWDVDTWDVIKLAFPMTSSGSIIITTTRINDVAKSCCSSFSGYIYGIRCLNVVHSRQLFHRRLFHSNEDCPLHLEKVFDQILQKCHGLPLAIITISGLLANRERTEVLWNQVKDSIGHALERSRGVKRMMKILSLSYFDLPPHLKSCLLYMSIFPEDSVIERKHLILRWIGEGFIHKEENYTVYEIGERCFNELLSRSLIQPAEINKYGKVKSCRVHDTILDFIICKSIEENFVTLLGVPIPTSLTQSKVVRRLSLQDVKQGNSTMPIAGLVLSHVRSLNVFGDFVEIPSLEEFRHLRVLDLRDHEGHHWEDHHLKSIMKLFHLRYLNLAYTGIIECPGRIIELPEQIGRLGCLEMLDLRSIKVMELPASIVNLRKLSYLFVGKNVKFPYGIAKMQELDTLKNVGVFKQPLEFLWGLGQLNNLRNLELDLLGEADFYRECTLFSNEEDNSRNLELDLHDEADSYGECTLFSDKEDNKPQPDTEDTYVVEECNKAIVSSLCKLGTRNLRSLIIWYGSNLLQEPLCMLTLEKLITVNSPISRVPKWVSSLRNLQQLRLEVKGVNQYDLCILGALPNLLILDLDGGLTQSAEKLRINGEVGFQFLRIFIYNAKIRPADLMFAAGSMPKLETLDLKYLRLIEGESLEFGIENLPCLVTVKCVVEDHYTDLFDVAKTAMESAASTHPNQPSLLFQDVCLTLLSHD